MPMLALLEPVTITSALSQISSLVTTGVSIITGNEVLMVLFCGSLLGVGFRIIRQAKGASRA